VRVGGSAIESVAADRERVRLVTRVVYADSAAPAEKYWYEVPAALAGDLARDGNPWLAALLPLAATLGEPLEWELPVDRPLLDGAREILRVWRSWYGETSVVPLRGPVAERPAGSPPPRTCAFLSGGVDSFFTALDHGDGDGRDERGPIDEFLFVGGLDLRLDSAEGIARARRSLEEVAQALGRPLVYVRTNLRELDTRWNKTVDWGRWGHGPALASVPLALGSRYGRALIPASNHYRHLVPWGSHPLTDSLLSSWTLRVRDDGAAHDRADKVRAIAGSELARNHLRVCFKSTDGRNCGRCQKCLVTMLMLDTVVGLSACPTFPGPPDLGLVRAFRIDKPWQRRHLGRLREFAVEKGRADVVRTVDYVLGWRGRLRHGARESVDRLFGRRALLRRAWWRAVDILRAPLGRGKPLRAKLRPPPETW
jgi:hypothetical protein